MHRGDDELLEPETFGWHRLVTVLRADTQNRGQQRHCGCPVQSTNINLVAQQTKSVSGGAVSLDTTTAFDQSSDGVQADVGMTLRPCQLKYGSARALSQVHGCRDQTRFPDTSFSAKHYARRE